MLLSALSKSLMAVSVLIQLDAEGTTYMNKGPTNGNMVAAYVRKGMLTRCFLMKAGHHWYLVTATYSIQAVLH